MEPSEEPGREGLISILNELSMTSSLGPAELEPETELHHQQKKKTEELQELIMCFICMGTVNKAMMCPFCSKLCCEACIVHWLQQTKESCPFCRCALKQHQLVNCRIVQEITDQMLLSSLQDTPHKHNAHRSAQKTRQPPNQHCPTHRLPLLYYCQTCQVATCSDCAMLGKHHKGHDFESIAVIYDKHLELIRNERQQLQGKVKYLKTMMMEVDEQIERVNANKEARNQEMLQVLQKMQQKLEFQQKKKLCVLFEQKETLGEDLLFLENIDHQIDAQIEQFAQNTLIQKSSELVSVLEEINRRQVKEGRRPEGVEWLDFENELTPAYVTGEYTLEEYSQVRDSQEVVYSPVLNSNCLQWRLKVYANGNGVAKGEFISIFLEVLDGLDRQSKYEYRIEMLPQSPGGQLVAREFASEFENGECWGYNRFFKIENLQKEGFWCPTEDKVRFRYQVRPITNYQLILDQQSYIAKLEEQNAQLRKEQQEEQSSIQRKEEQSSIQRKEEQSSIIRKEEQSSIIRKEEQSLLRKEEQSLLRKDHQE